MANLKTGRPLKAKSLKEFFASGNGRTLWKQGRAEYEKGGGSDIEFDDGKYLVKVQKAESGVSKASGRVQNMVAFKFIDGEYKGKIKYWYQGLENEIGISVMLQAFKKFGHETENPQDIDEINKKLTKEGPVCEIRLKTDPIRSFQNVAVLKMVDGAEAEIDDEEKDEEEEDTDASVEKESPKKSSKKVAKEEPEEDEDEDEDDDAEDSDEDEQADDEDAVEEEKPEPKKTKKPVKEEVEQDDEDEDDEDEDEDEEDEKEEAEEDEVALEVGMKVKVKYEGEEVKGKIVKILEEKKKVKVKLADGTKILVGLEDIVDVLS